MVRMVGDGRVFCVRCGWGESEERTRENPDGRFVCERCGFDSAKPPGFYSD